MGNFCSQNHKQLTKRTGEVNTNIIMSEFEIKNNIEVQLIVGSYRQHRADLLLVFAQLQDIQYSPEIKDYAQNYLELIETANLRTKSVFSVQSNPSCPYKRFVVAVLPSYDSQQAEPYFKKFEIMISEILITCSEVAMQIFPTSQNGKGIPNQTLISLFIKYLQKYDRPILIYLISAQTRLLNMVRYQMAKLGTFVPLIKPQQQE